MPISKVNRLGLATDAQNYTIDTFTGDGSTVAFTLSQDPVSNTDLIVSVGGVLQAPTTNYTLSGTTLTFTGAPDATIPIMVTHLTYRNGAKEFTPDDGSVTSSKLAANIDIAGTLDVTGATTLDSGLTVDTSTLVVDATNNRVGIGEANPTHLLELQLPAATNGPMIKMARSAGAYNMFIGVTSDSDMAIYDNSETERLRFMNQGGISFDAGSNYLDDYEEGTLSWVVKKTDGTAGNDNGSSVKYTKIGQVVFIVGKLRYDSNTSSGAGELEIVGSLPFVPNVTGGIPITHIRSEDGSPSTMAAVTFASGSVNVFIHQSQNSYDTNNNNLGAVTQTNIVLEFNGHYTTSS